MASLPLAMTETYRPASVGSVSRADTPCNNNDRAGAIIHRSDFMLGLFGKAGWYVAAAGHRSGPFPDRSAAEQVAFYDRHYG